MMYVSQPYENTPGVFNIKLSLPVTTPEWAVEGAVSAILNPEYFDAVMRSALYAEDMNIAITGEDGRRLLFVPANAAQMRMGSSPAAGRRISCEAPAWWRRHQRACAAPTRRDNPG
jgi:hypothetical protein